jgi:hypothetical protein
MNKKREKALEGLTRIAQVIISDKYHDESNEVLIFSKAIERIVTLKGSYLPKTHKDTVLSMSISDDDDNDGSDFIRLHPVYESEGRDPITGFTSFQPINTHEELTNADENDDDSKKREAENEEEKINEEEKGKAEEKGEKEVVPLKGEFLLNEKVIKFAYSLDKSDDSLWNITDGSPKIKNFKEHFGDEFNMKSSELRGLLIGFTR